MRVRIALDELRRIRELSNTIKALAAEIAQLVAEIAGAAGVAPIPVSSGKTNRHRLDRGGNRPITATIHRIAVTRLRSSPAASGTCSRPPAPSRNRRSHHQLLDIRAAKAAVGIDAFPRERRLALLVLLSSERDRCEPRRAPASEQQDRRRPGSALALRDKSRERKERVDVARPPAPALWPAESLIPHWARPAGRCPAPTATYATTWRSSSAGASRVPAQRGSGTSGSASLCAGARRSYPSRRARRADLHGPLLVGRATVCLPPNRSPTRTRQRTGPCRSDCPFLG
jgi:Transposase IS116/IS110/IS902 family